MHRRRGYTHPYALEDTWGLAWTSPSLRWCFGVSREFGWRGNSRRPAFGERCHLCLEWDCSSCLRC
jgi:hypothetical protein